MIEKQQSQNIESNYTKEDAKLRTSIAGCVASGTVITLVFWLLIVIGFEISSPAEIIISSIFFRLLCFFLLIPIGICISILTGLKIKRFRTMFQYPINKTLISLGKFGIFLCLSPIITLILLMIFSYISLTILQTS